MQVFCLDWLANMTSDPLWILPPTVLKLHLPVTARVPGDPAAGRHAYASGAVTQ